MADGITENGEEERVASVKDATGLTIGLASVPDTQTDPDHELRFCPFLMKYVGVSRNRLPTPNYMSRLEEGLLKY